MKWEYQDSILKVYDQQGSPIGEADFSDFIEGQLNIRRIYVHEAFRNQGFGKSIMLAVLEYQRENHLKVTATCPYAINWLVKNQESCKDILSEDFFLGKENI